ncbi:MAG: MoxR family ATPase, partial [Planctomycetaceae bacterium]|nr:MoxR family ATPase [Planctomycetaceae bacterium]
NPIEQEGTYPLPEAQLDRFMFNIVVKYPSAAEELRILKATTGSNVPELKPALTGEQILALQEVVRKVPVGEHVFVYARDLARATRPTEDDAPGFIKKYLSWGAGPRAGQYLILGAKARAILEGRFHVTTDDVRSVAHPVLRHRILTTFQADTEGITPENVIDKLISHVPVAVQEKAKRLQGGS